jgi:hypothetical protein
MKQISKGDQSQARLKSSLTTQLTSTATAHLPCNNSKSKFFNRYKSLINNRKMREEVSYSS